MHEMGLAMAIYDTCRAAVARQGPGRLEWVRVAVGELAAVEPDLLRFAWEALTAEGPDAGSVLEVEWRPAEQRCPACGDVAERAPGSWLRLCPACGSPLRVEGGDDLDVLRLSFMPYDDEGGESE